tara:strand:- start:479 stop:751 length:273 start_codon:yes stop_codon:yes gene_type:complete
MIVKYVTVDLLKKLNDSAIKNKRNRAISDEYMETLLKRTEKDIKFPIAASFPHNHDLERRCKIITDGDKNESVYLDIDLLDWDKLPKAVL